MIMHYWERTIRARWSSVFAAFSVAALSATLFAAAVKHSATKTKRSTTSSAKKTAPAASTAPKAKAAGAAALLALAQKQLDSNNLQTAVEYASRAAQALSRYRLPEEAARTLALRKPPAWVFLHGLKSPLSSTALRAERSKTVT